MGQALNSTPRASTKQLLPLHYIQICVFPLHSTLLYQGPGWLYQATGRKEKIKNNWQMWDSNPSLAAEIAMPHH
jgi:hypothetical protein